MKLPVSIAKRSKFLSMDSRIGAIKKYHVSRKPLSLQVPGIAFPVDVLVQIKKTGSWASWSHRVAALY